MLSEQAFSVLSARPWRQSDPEMDANSAYNLFLGGDNVRMGWQRDHLQPSGGSYRREASSRLIEVLVGELYDFWRKLVLKRNVCNCLKFKC